MKHTHMIAVIQAELAGLPVEQQFLASVSGLWWPKRRDAGFNFSQSRYRVNLNIRTKYAVQ